MVARNHEKAQEAVREVTKMSMATSRRRNEEMRLFPVVCDHSSLQSVREFCVDLKRRLQLESEKVGHRVGIDVLCLNAGILLAADEPAQYTEDDLELTIQTNHFAPFLITTQLIELINPGSRVVVTTSELHAISGTSFGDFKGVIDALTGKLRADFEMVDGSSYDYKKCYSISKLCNVAFCLELNRRLQERNAKAICFTPGLIPSTGIFRRQKRWHETLLTKQELFEKEEWGGVMLAWMAISDKAVEEGGSYWRAPFGISNRGGIIPDDLYTAPINNEAKDVQNQLRLWEISVALTTPDSGRIVVG